MQALDIPIIFKTYELYKALQILQKNIPKAERYTLWQKIEIRTIETLEILLLAGYRPPSERLSELIRASANVDLLRILLRLSYETKIITNKNYLDLQKSLDEIGRMLGGWIKSLRTGSGSK